jgi:hypothetical protein
MYNACDCERRLLCKIDDRGLSRKTVGQARSTGMPFFFDSRPGGVRHCFHLVRLDPWNSESGKWRRPRPKLVVFTEIHSGFSQRSRPHLPARVSSSSYFPGTLSLHFGAVVAQAAKNINPMSNTNTFSSSFLFGISNSHSDVGPDQASNCVQNALIMSQWCRHWGLNPPFPLPKGGMSPF